MDEEFTAIIASGIEYSGVSPYKLPQSSPSPRTPGAPFSPSPHSSHKKPPLTPTKRSESFSAANTRAVPENGRPPPRGLIAHSKSLTFPSCNLALDDDSFSPSPWRSARGGGPSPGAQVILKQPMSADRHDSSPASNPAPIRSLFFSRHSLKQVSVDVRRLRQLARQGSWKLLVERVKDAQKRGLLATPDQEITYGTYHLLALMKLQDYRAASDEIAAFGDLDSPQYRFENHPTLYPGKSGSMVPFALRCMHAELPHRVGNTATTLNRLYNLLAHCDSQIDALQEAERSLDNEGTKESVASADSFLEGLLLTWQKRREAVCFALVGHHLNQQQFMVALQWLNKLMAKSPTDPYLRTKSALIQLQLGDILGAQRTFSDVEALVSPASDPELHNLVGRNRGILYVALGEFPKAIHEFDAVLARDPDDIVSANNKALCLLYSLKLVDATQILENAIYKGPKRLVNEAVVVNACNMYELVSSSSAAAKRGVRTWIKEHGPDDFEPSSFRL